MKNFILNLYRKYLYDSISLDEFKEMRYLLNKTDDREFSVLMEQEWINAFCTETMDEESKGKIREKINFYIENEQRCKRRRFFLRSIAVLVPLIAGSIFLLTLGMLKKETGIFIVRVERGDKAVVSLPDQSKVWLNSNSELQYDNRSRSDRNVELRGEAFFKVAKDEKRPFRLTLNDLEVEVLGTSFNAKARDQADIIEVSLLEGSVKLNSSDLARSYRLKPDEKAIYQRSSKSIRIVNTDHELETAWKNNELKFSSERFLDVLNMIGDWYGVDIVCKCPEIENDLISGSFKEENLETTLEVLRIQYDIQYIRKRNTIIIYK